MVLQKSRRKTSDSQNQSNNTTCVTENIDAKVLTKARRQNKTLLEDLFVSVLFCKYIVFYNFVVKRRRRHRSSAGVPSGSLLGELWIWGWHCLHVAWKRVGMDSKQPDLFQHLHRMILKILHGKSCLKCELVKRIWGSFCIWMHFRHPLEEAPESWEKSKTVVSTWSTCRREVVGGEILKLPFTGVMPAEPVTTPLLRARGMSFLDTNPLAAKVGRPKKRFSDAIFFFQPKSGPNCGLNSTSSLQVYGTLTITSAASEADVTHYHVYYGSSDFQAFPCISSHFMIYSIYSLF